MSENKILLGNDRNAVIALFAMNMGLFMFIKAATILFATTPNIANGDSLSIVEQNLVLTPQLTDFIQQPWSFFTHFFTHTTLVNLLSNMLWLGLFSVLAQKIVGNGSLIPVYIYGGLVASGVAIIEAALGSGITQLYGAQSGILAMVGMLFAYKTDYKVLKEINNGGIKINLICYLYLGLYLLTQAQFETIVNGKFELKPFFNIITGAAAFVVGYFYGKNLLKGKDWGRWMHSLYDDLLGKGMVPTKQKKDIYYETTVTPFSKKLTQNEENLNSILEKINLTGINSLTQEEQVFLQQIKNT